MVGPSLVLTCNADVEYDIKFHVFDALNRECDMCRVIKNCTISSIKRK